MVVTEPTNQAKQPTIEAKLRAFAQGRIPVPLCVDGDAYTVAGQALSSDKAAEKSVYGLAFRRSPTDAPEFEGVVKERDDRMILYGLTDYIRDRLTKPLTREQLDDACEFMSTAHAFGGPLPLNRKIWERVIDEYDGYLPIKIEALPEGSTFYPNEIPVQITPVAEGFGELAALVEAHLVGMVANASARATLERHLLERFREYAREDDPTATEEDVLFRAQLMVHDFGMRASSTPHESEIYGRAHLLCFPGTDTFNAAYQAWVMNDKKRVGSSILALAHRTVQGADSEKAAFQRMREAAGKGGIGSYVADCFDFHAAVHDELLPMAVEASQTDKAIIVGRPDSGDPEENVLYILDEARGAGLYKTQPNGRLAMTHLTNIQGDSMNWKKMKAITEAKKAHGYSPVNCGIFGVGGWLRNTPSRDTLSVGDKLMSKGNDGEPMVKLSDTRAKMSVPGPVVVLRGQSTEEPSVRMQYERNYHGENALQVFYDGSAKGVDRYKASCVEDFSTVQQRVIHEFDASPARRRVLSDEILRLQNETLKAHGRGVEDYEY